MGIKSHDNGLLPPHLGIGSNDSVEGTMPKARSEPAAATDSKTEPAQDADRWKAKLEGGNSPTVSPRFSGF